MENATNRRWGDFVSCRVEKMKCKRCNSTDRVADDLCFSCWIYAQGLYSAWCIMNGVSLLSGIGLEKMRKIEQNVALERTV